MLSIQVLMRLKSVTRERELERRGDWKSVSISGASAGVNIPSKKQDISEELLLELRQVRFNF